MSEGKKIFESFYEIGEWAGKEQYRCKKCNFNTTKKEKAISHISQHITGADKIPSKPEKAETLDSLPPVQVEAQEKIDKMSGKKEE